jgi:4-hydroxy-tetrahydrodipicolinate reductase
MKENLRVIQFGLGPIGAAMARHVIERPNLELVGGVDIDPVKVDKDLGSVIGLDEPLGASVYGSLNELIEDIKGDVILHTTNSYFSQFKTQILEILDLGFDIVSTSEELAYPWVDHHDEAMEIDDAAKKVKKTVLGTGVNPGFLMDSLPLFLTSICQQVDCIDVQRVINASLRRGPFQAKIGSGLSEDEFNQRIEAGTMGHVGLPESMAMVMETLGKKLTHYESKVEPVIAQHAIETDYFSIQPGQVSGLKQVARGFSGERVFLTLSFIAALEAEDEKDTIKIEGKPDLEITLRGTNGDLATVAIAVNAIQRVLEAPPGLVTMCDLPLVTF